MAGSKKLNIFCIFIALVVFAVFFVGRKNISESYMERCNNSGIIESRSVVLSDCLFAEVMGDDDVAADASLKKAEILYEGGDLDSAEQEFLRVLANDPENLKTNVSLAEIYHDKGDFLKAEEYYSKTYGMGLSEGVLTDRVKNLVRCGKAAEAKALLENGSVEGEDILFYDALLVFAGNNFSNNVFYVEGGEKYKEATSLIRDFLDSNTTASMSEEYIAIKKADLFMRIGENDFAFMELEKIKEDKKYRDLMISYGKVYFLDGDYEKSEQYFLEALNIDSNSSEALIYLSEICTISGRKEEARLFFLRYEDGKNV